MGPLHRDQRPQVLLGYDASQDNDAALRWAVDEARVRGLELVLCHCWHWPYPEGYVDVDVKAILKEAGDRLLDHGAARARALGATEAPAKRLRAEPVPDALVSESFEAELIVIGSHEQHHLLAGSTALQLPARARRPVLTVRRYRAPRRVVVAGVDESAGGDAALGFAMEEAALRNWRLRAVYGIWEPGAVPEAEVPLFTDKEKLIRVRTTALERIVAPWRQRYPRVDLQLCVVPDRPRETLLRAADQADLLVVGARGSGGLDRMLLGATSSAMLHHAPCTVATVPSDTRT